MNNFTARTRLRGEVTYHDAEWVKDPRDERKHRVRFLSGPHAGNGYPEGMCAIAKDDKYLLGDKNVS